MVIKKYCCTQALENAERALFALLANTIPHSVSQSLTQSVSQRICSSVCLSVPQSKANRAARWSLVSILTHKILLILQKYSHFWAEQAALHALPTNEKLCK